jgi:hypothetical protein
VVNDLVVTLCCLECRNIDFQQAKGRNVGVAVAMIVVLEQDDVPLKLPQDKNPRRVLIGYRKHQIISTAWNLAADQILFSQQRQILSIAVRSSSCAHRGYYEWKKSWESLSLLRLHGQELHKKSYHPAEELRKLTVMAEAW